MDEIAGSYGSRVTQNCWLAPADSIKVLSDNLFLDPTSIEKCSVASALPNRGNAQMEFPDKRPNTNFKEDLLEYSLVIGQTES